MKGLAIVSTTIRASAQCASHAAAEPWQLSIVKMSPQ
eukprot:CAMPEP_0174745248 /NCGR_PEP_ID=MMETSP1094-20130205/86362_1 /TAXON_ID=156173 /ORGANISM="Chrysochromulina brevifilum, Strain UTEX LB 985" /LENGTH=36 /DNA_ID= /DNA_START= /DNA_END= /DNA_ORIENTATION=